MLKLFSKHFGGEKSNMSPEEIQELRNARHEFRARIEAVAALAERGVDAIERERDRLAADLERVGAERVALMNEVKSLTLENAQLRDALNNREDLDFNVAVVTAHLEQLLSVLKADQSV